ncbi:hypothetical protein EXIGLDRAFT_746780 [Exidia glandulosa HHB12029]|uniref:Ferritin-like domain-containing protein n=1 Tax=Exidia glandulosa HHB12029 TaxID=1314781 RepID=A0A166B5Y2_EXIGL|nr:hypothetical protein EXIGLDRAFT_746780 [Exidia glandulosa HHB12029]
MLAPLSLIVAAFASAVVAAGNAPAGVTDTVILQYALTLEHLEAAFYKEALEKFNASQFASGGEQHALFAQIADHEATHVKVLESILGDQATKACNYSFPYTDLQGFKSLAQILEGVGVTAYLGAAQFISDPDTLTAAGSILTTEARHAAWLATTNGGDPWPGAFDTPLAFSQVFSLAAPFITSCPSTNPTLPVKAFPGLTLSSPSNGSLKPGSNVTLEVSSAYNATTETPLYVAFLTGTSVVFAPYSANQSFVIPMGVNSTGTIYAVITSSNSSASDDNTVAGPVILQFSAQYPENVVAGSSTGNGTGLPGTDSGSDGGSSSTGGSADTGAGVALTPRALAAACIALLVATAL